MVQSKRKSNKVKVSEGKEDCWLYQGECLTEPLEGKYGYVYKILNTKTNFIYIGKKAFLFRKKTYLSKKARVGTRKRVEIGTKDSGWLKYWGSSKSLLEDINKLGKENFKREILCFAKNKSELSYLEVVEQIKNNVMFIPSYNGWISCRIMKNRL